MVLPRLPLGLAGEAGEEGPGLPRGAGAAPPDGTPLGACVLLLIFLMCLCEDTVPSPQSGTLTPMAAQLWLSLVLWMERRGVRELVLFLALLPLLAHDSHGTLGQVWPLKKAHVRVRARGPVMADAALAGRVTVGAGGSAAPQAPRRAYSPTVAAARRPLSAGPGGPGSSQLPVHVGWDFCSFTRL